MANSAIFPIYLRTEYRSDGLKEFVRSANDAANKAKREFEGVGEALDRALSRSRNKAGSLDLDIDEMRQAAAAQQQIAIAAREVAEATNRAATANGQFNASMAGATAAANALAASEEKAAREALEQVQALEAVQRELNKTASATNEVIASQRRGTTERGNVINSVRAERTAFIQLGQQMQDISIQTQMGTDAMLIFGQQVPQIAFALSGLENSADKTKAAVGRFATFMSGPFGTLIFLGIAALGPLIMKLFETGDEADKARTKVFNFADGLDVLKLSAEDATAAMDQLAGSLKSAIKLQGDFLARDIAIARNQAGRIQEQIAKDQAELNRLRGNRSGVGANLLPSVFGPGGDALRREAELVKRLEENRKNVGPILETTVLAEIAETDRAITSALDPIEAKIIAVDEALGKLTDRRRATIIANDPLRDGNVSRAEFDAERERLTRQRKALEDEQREARKKPRSGRTPRDTTVRDQATTDRFLEQSAERVFRINERFQQQGRLVQQSAQATRQLDLIIADVNRRMTLARNLTAEQRLEFQRIVQEAEDAKQTIENALLLPLQEARIESERRVQIQTLIAQGQFDEAAALQAIFQLEERLGQEAILRAQIQDLIVAGKNEEAAAIQAKLNALLSQKVGLREIVLLEQEQIRELQRKQVLMEAQANVVRTVAGDLRSILSGRSTDFFGNFQQALKDLQGARLFESLFGPAFQALEQELAGNTPEGRANRAYVQAVTETKQATDTLTETLKELNNAFDETFGVITRINAGAANDNGVMSEIRVNGTKPPPAEFAQKSIKEIAREISREAVKPGVELLSRLIGRELAGAVGNIAAGVIEGQARAGTVGGVLGGLRELTGGITALQGVSKKLGEALDGAQTGSQINAIGQALGFRGSATGAQLGGAFGGLLTSITSIPGLDAVGGFLGNIIGALFSGIPKGSATINGVGVNSVVGNRGSLREAVGGLGGNVNDIVSQVAKQLGGRINAAAAPVSIGIRDGDFRVDPRGRGTTRVKGGAIDFGQDQEAAVRYAAMLLIERGVIAGIKASEQRLLQAGKTLEDGLRDVLDFRGVFDRLREIRDPVGFAVERLNREFERMIDLFNRAGAGAAEFADLRDLYDLDRARAIEDANSRIVGALQSLLNELTIGNSGLSLRSRQQNALAQFDSLASRVAAGDTSAFDDFADISKQLLDIERQLFGSTQSYFDRLAQITALTEKAVADQTNVTSIAAAQPSPFPDRVEIDRSIDIQTRELAGWLRAINETQIAIASRGPSANDDFQNRSLLGGGGGGLLNFPTQMLAF